MSVAKKSKHLAAQKSLPVSFCDVTQEQAAQFGVGRHNAKAFEKL
jgi:hypothetical protein